MSCLERCPQFGGVLRKVFHCTGVGKCVIVSEVSSFQRLKEWYILGVGKCVLFRKVSSVRGCP